MNTTWFTTWLEQQTAQATTDQLAHNTFLCCSLAFLGVIEVTGTDAEKFLQGQLTCDLKAVTPTQACLGAHCNLQGRMVSGFYLIFTANNYYLILPSDVLPTALAHLAHYARFSRVTLRDASADCPLIGLMGQQAEPFLASQGCTVPSQALQVSLLQDGILLRVVGEEPRYLLRASPATLQTIWQNAIQIGGLVADAKMWALHDLIAGFVLIQLGISGKFTPHELNYPHWQAVSFNKGCYLGQEIVARMHYRGQLKQHLRYLRGTLQQPIALFADITSATDHAHVGHIAMVEQAVTGEFQALAVMSDKACEAGGAWMIAGELVLDSTLSYK